MVDISQKPDFQSDGTFSAIAGVIQSAFRSVDKVLISEGAAKARMRQVETLNAKSDEELAAIGLDREDIVKVVFSDYTRM